MGKSRVKGIVVEIGGDTGPLDKALQGTNKNINTTQSKLKDVERLLKLDPKNTVLLEQKQKLLAQAISETEGKLQTLNTANDQVKDSVKNYDAWKAAYDPIQVEIDTTTQKLKELKNQQKEMADCGEVDTDAYQQLTQEIQNTNKELRDLKDQAKAVNDEFGNPASTDQYDALQREIEATKLDLKALEDKAGDTARKINNIDEKPVEDVEQAAEGAAGALGKASKEASTFGDVLKADLAVEGLNWLKDTAEDTKEYRKSMASLQVSAEENGYTFEQTQEALKRLYGVLGDDQASKTALANLQAITPNVEKLNILIDGSIGGWARFGDSIPIDSLAEAYNEYVKTGEVTGALADLINWAANENERFGVQTRQATDAQKALSEATQGVSRNSQEYIDAVWEKIDAQSNDISSSQTAVNIQAVESAAMESLAENTEKATAKKKEATDANEDYNKSVEEAKTPLDFFTIASNECASGQERLDLLIKTIGGFSLPQMAAKWRESNESMVDANEATADLQEQLAILGEEIEPLLTNLVEMATSLLETFNNLDPGTQKLIISLVALVAAIGPVGNAISGASKIMGLFSKDGISGLVSVLGGLTGNTLPATTTSFDKASNQWVTKLDTSTTTIATGVLPKLQNAFSTVFTFIKAHPIASFVVAIGVFGDEIQSILQGLDDFLQFVFAGDWKDVLGPVLGDAMNGFLLATKQVWDSVKEILDGVIDFIRGVFTADWERAWKGVVSVVSGLFNGLLNIVRVPVNAILAMLNGIISTCNLAIDKLNKLPGVNIEKWDKVEYWEYTSVSDSGNGTLASGMTQEEIDRIIERDPEYMVSLLDSGSTGSQSTVSNSYSTSNTFTGDIVINAAEGQDVEEMGNLVMEAIQRHYESAEAGLT